jgi:chondroitin AC lyase
MTHTTAALFSLVVVVVAVTLVEADDVGDLAVVRARLRADLLASVSAASAASSSISYLKQFSSTTGQFADIDYASTSRSNWAPADHAARVLRWSIAYTRPDCKLHQNATILAAIRRAVDYWLTADPQSDNWWYNQISVPQSFGGAVVLLNGTELSAAQDSALCAIMRRATVAGMTGTNLVWVIVVQVEIGLHDNNATHVRWAYQLMWSTLTLFPKTLEGPKIDGIFMQHGMLPYNGGYGQSFLSDVSTAMYRTAGTSFAMNATNRDAFDVLVDGDRWFCVFRKSTTNSIWDVSVKGRELTRKGSPTIEGSVAASLSRVGYTSMASYLTSGTPNVLGHRQFWIGDTTVHREQNSSVFIRMNSNRTVNNECVNSEGTQSIHLADGLRSIHVDATEYFDIYPLWNWAKLPGTTLAQNNTPMTCANTKKASPQKYVGGVASGVYGTAAFDFRSPDSPVLTAKKTWFWLDSGAFVELGSNIVWPASVVATTVLEQNWLNPPVYTSSNASQPLSNKSTLRITHQAGETRWVHHRRIGYALFEADGDDTNVLVVETPTKTGSWSLIGTGSSAAVSGNVFSAWVEHSAASGSSYAILIMPAISYADFRSQLLTRLSEHVILARNIKMHAMMNIRTGVIGAVFFSSAGGTVCDADGRAIFSVDSAVSVILRRSSSSITISVASPARDVYATTVRIHGCSLCTGPGVSASGNDTAVAISLGKGEYAGQTTTVSISCSACDVIPSGSDVDLSSDGSGSAPRSDHPPPSGSDSDDLSAASCCITFIYILVPLAIAIWL